MVSVFSVIFAIVWAILMLTGLGPRQQTVETVRLISGLILFELYLAAFALCCSIADLANEGGTSSSIKGGFGAGSFFQLLGLDDPCCGRRVNVVFLRRNLSESIKRTVIRDLILSITASKYEIGVPVRTIF